MIEHFLDDWEPAQTLFVTLDTEYTTKQDDVGQGNRQ